MGKALTFRKDLKQRYEGAEWVLVTAGTGAIGEALCLEFAKAGFNVIIMSKSTIGAGKVKSAVKELGQQAEIIKYDFGKLTTEQEAEALKKAIEEKTKGKNVGILVNNVTLAATVPLFHGINFAQLMQAISANVFAQSVMTRIMAAKWLEDRKGKQCLVIDYSGGGLASPLASDPVFAGSKTYAQVLSRSLDAQYKSFHDDDPGEHPSIEFMQVHPQGVIGAYAEESRAKVAPEAHAKAVLDSIGSAKSL